MFFNWGRYSILTVCTAHIQMERATLVTQRQRDSWVMKLPIKPYNVEEETPVVQRRHGHPKIHRRPW